MKKTALLIMLFTLLSKLLGFIRDIALSYFYGTSYISDVYLIALTIPMVIFALIGTGIKTGYIPVYGRLLETEGKKVSDNYTNNLVSIFLLIATLICTLGILFSPQLIKLFASGFEGKTFQLAVKLTRISFLSIYFTGLVYIFSGYLQTNNRYLSPALIGVPMNIVYIVSIYYSTIKGEIILGIGIVLAALVQVLVLIPSLYGLRFKFRPYFEFENKDINKTIKLMIPVTLGVSVNQINTLIDRTLASRIVEGGISALNYADRINILIQGVFVMTIITILFPKIVQHAVNGDMYQFRKKLFNGVNIIMVVVVPVAFISMIFSQPIVEFLYKRGEFGSEAVMLTSSAMFFCSIGIFGHSLRELLSRGFYALEDTKTPMINSAIGMLINIFLNLLLAPILGIGGLALATSISSLVISFLLFYNLYKKIGSFNFKEMLSTFIKVLFASAIIGIVSILIYNNLLPVLHKSLSLIITLSLGGFSYVILIYFLNIEVVNNIFHSLLNKMKKRS